MQRIRVSGASNGRSPRRRRSTMALRDSRINAIVQLDLLHVGRRFFFIAFCTRTHIHMWDASILRGYNGRARFLNFDAPNVIGSLVNEALHENSRTSMRVCLVITILRGFRSRILLGDSIVDLVILLMLGMIIDWDL